MKQECKATPGPWTHHKSDVHFHIESEDRRICEVRYASNEDTGWTSTSEANARLIAAAPELLDVLEFIVEQVSDPANAAHTLDNFRHGAGIAMARAAIAKATGEA